MFTRKDFEATARILREGRENATDLTGISVIDELTERFASLYAASNARFDHDRFYGAVGYKPD